MKTLKRDKVVLDFREKQREQRGVLAGQYPHVVEDKIYYQMETPKEIHYAIENGEGYRKPLYNNIISKSLASHNFSVFVDTNPDTPEDERYKAVGGYHVGRASTKTPHLLGLHQATLYGELNDCPISKGLEIVPFQDPVWPEFTKLLFKDDFFHPRHANGLYIFKSKDGIDWKEYHNEPIFSTFTKDVLAFDTLPSIFYDHNIEEYVIYLRANIRLGVRCVMYSRSKDLIKWSEPILIETDPPFDMNQENLYYMCAFPFGKKYIAFPPHFNNVIISDSHRLYSDAKTKVMISDDGIKWKTIDEILSSDTEGHMTFPHVVSFREEEDGYALYVHEDFMTSNNKLVRYTIDKEEMEELVALEGYAVQ